MNLNFTLTAPDKVSPGEPVIITATIRDGDRVISTVQRQVSTTGTITPPPPHPVKINQQITFAGPTSPIDFVADQQITLSAVASSGLPVLFGKGSASVGVGALSGNVLTITGPGTIIITADQAGNNAYNAAPQVRRTLVVNAI